MRKEKIPKYGKSLLKNRYMKLKYVVWILALITCSAKISNYYSLFLLPLQSLIYGAVLVLTAVEVVK